MTARKNELIKNFDHLETLKFSHATVKGFTEQGLYMLATILKSPMATATELPLEEIQKLKEQVEASWTFASFAPHALKGQKLLAQGDALG